VAFAVCAPGSAQLVGPVLVKGRHVFARDVACDLARAARRPPVDQNPFTGALMMRRRKRAAEFVADGFVVRRDDDERPIAARRNAIVAQRDRRNQDERERDQPWKLRLHVEGSAMTSLRSTEMKSEPRSARFRTRGLSS